MSQTSSAPAGAPSSPHHIVAFDPGDLALPEVEHLARALAHSLAGARDICTYPVSEPAPHECAVVALDVAADVVTLLRATREALASLGVASAGIAVWSADTGAIRTAGGLADVAGAIAALTARRDQAGGRAILFPGQEHLRGVLSIRDVLERSAVAAIDSLGIAVTPDTLVVTRDFVRPVYREGRLVLALRPRADAMGCFEQPDPTPCCAMH